MNKLVQRIRCKFGYHENERLPSPPGIMHGVFGPYRCRCCGHSHPGFPMLDYSDLFQHSEKGIAVMSGNVTEGETTLTVEECRKKKVDLAENILALLVQFTNDTGLHINAVEVGTSYDARIDFSAYGVSIEVAL